ncbi:hypothetical protein TNIN_220171 [Trichonephila inaurata madagascariensis]|uniref:Uncharacterized protein n=1 Tax=Trichonephila inaurata madagascariensis TaxID=2747483 RepID=A0A8X6XV28_9ARAC|nr:hypothetical protein TNIN_220171 [Trichonephila inaurata madagascariensis]
MKSEIHSTEQLLPLVRERLRACPELGGDAVRNKLGRSVILRNVCTIPGPENPETQTDRRSTGNDEISYTIPFRRFLIGSCSENTWSTG